MKLLNKNLRKIKIILQARTSSKRLINKILLPINKYELVVLCAKRISSKNIDFVVATSSNKSDDRLCSILKKRKINYFRGNLKNVLKRFLDCTKDLNKDDIIVRVTADNPVPDKYLLEEQLKILINNNLNYINTNNCIKNAPYGLMIEIFTKEMLDQTYKNYKNTLHFKKIKEHVTIKFRNDKFFQKYKIEKINCKKNLNISIDYKSDYNKAFNIFKNISNPVTIKWFDLLKHYNK